MSAADMAPMAPSPSLLSVSVVLPTHGRRASLLRVLCALCHQSVPADSFEVLVICDGDIDGSAAACRALMPRLSYTLRVLEQDNQGPAAARNRGVEEARAPLIVFLDDDVVPDERLLAAHLDAQAGHDMRVTIGPLLPPPNYRMSIWGAWEERALCRQYDDMLAGRWQATHRQFYTGNAAVLKRHIVGAGGFDPAFRRAEDVELALRMRDRGLTFIFLPEARGWHYIQRTYASWLRVPTAYGAADVAMATAGHQGTLTEVACYFRQRNWPVRVLTRLCAGRPAARAVITVLGLLVRGANLATLDLVGNALCSLIFNLSYYHAFAHALGGRAAFVALLDGRDTATPVRPHASTN